VHVQSTRRYGHFKTEIRAAIYVHINGENKRLFTAAVNDAKENIISRLEELVNENMAGLF
jgi:predicted Zn-dependent peptidase